jgi:starvation-inducible DNA-binding protein
VGGSRAQFLRDMVSMPHSYGFSGDFAKQLWRPIVNKANDVAPDLDTPSNLSATGVNAISTALNVLLADAFALYLKTKNFHWHVSGRHFRDYHLMLDEQAEAIFESTDELAERVRKIGGVEDVATASLLENFIDETERRTWFLFEASRQIGGNAK